MSYIASDDEPLTRSREDENLKRLRGRDRKRDPMLAFIKKEKKRELELPGKKGDHQNISLKLMLLFSVSMNCTS